MHQHFIPRARRIAGIAILLLLTACATVPEDREPPGARQLLGHADLYVVRAPDLEWTRTRRDREAVSVSLVDTRGFQMMRYQTPLDASGMLSDLRHLMRLSNEELEELNAFPQGR